uniref:Uncharacterized protein n=1 Tax=Magallana gigas TaxID=29159 RepID=K1QLV9_MAGGI
MEVWSGAISPSWLAGLPIKAGLAGKYQCSELPVIETDARPGSSESERKSTGSTNDPTRTIEYIHISCVPTPEFNKVSFNQTLIVGDPRVIHKLPWFATIPDARLSP